MAEYSSDKMDREAPYLNIESRWSYELSYELNKFTKVNAQHLHGSTFSLTANIHFNPKRPPFDAGLELAPVPTRKRNQKSFIMKESDFEVIKKVLNVDNFEILNLDEDKDRIRIDIKNQKFRSYAQAVGRISSTLQRFSKDEVHYAEIVFHSGGLQTASYLVDLSKITSNQFVKANSNQQTLR